MNPEKSGETNLLAFLGRQEKTRLTNFSLKFYNTFTSIFTFEFSRPFSNSQVTSHSVQGDSRDAESV